MNKFILLFPIIFCSMFAHGEYAQRSGDRYFIGNTIFSIFRTGDELTDEHLLNLIKRNITKQVHIFGSPCDLYETRILSASESISTPEYLEDATSTEFVFSDDSGEFCYLPEELEVPHNQIYFSLRSGFILKTCAEIFFPLNPLAEVEGSVVSDEDYVFESDLNSYVKSAFSKVCQGFDKTNKCTFNKSNILKALRLFYPFMKMPNDEFFEELWIINKSYKTDNEKFKYFLYSVCIDGNWQ